MEVKTMDIRNMEPIYINIGQQVNQIIPEPWDRVLLYSEVTEESNRTYFYYYPHNKETPIYSLDIEEMIDIDEYEVNRQLHQLYKYLKELWVVTKNLNQQQWTNLTLELNSDGKFNIDFKYNNLVNEDSYEQQIIWEYERLGLVPNEDRSRDVKIIEEYRENNKG